MISHLQLVCLSQKSVKLQIQSNSKKDSPAERNIQYLVKTKNKESKKRCLPIRKHREARENRYSFGYAVFLILALMK